MPDRPAVTPSWRLALEPALTGLFRLWWRVRRGMTLGVRGIACDENGRVMLIRHTYQRGWHLPGGGVESRETAATAAKREMAEEAGIEAVGEPELIGFYSNHANHPNDHVAVFRFVTWKPCSPSADGEIAERRFFALADLPSDTSPGTRRRLGEAFEGAPISPDW